MAFAVPLGRLAICPDDAAGLLEGSIDLLVRTAERTTVLDYKTDRFQPRGRKAVEERYWPQLTLYALAAEACGHSDGEAELALFFVRAGTISRRPLDQELLGRVASQVARALAGEG
ncbi:MAG: PD-(D/E)XK nuclease family protein [Candidatus Brocadiae bacterium]|nr:PD-(D/E)XK nuclease family protein [Candidatus Brocadiia bacterium]